MKADNAAFLARIGIKSLNQRYSSSALAQRAATATVERRLRLKSLSGLGSSFLAFPNRSYGKFTAQVTVAFNSIVGLLDGTTCAFLEVRQPELEPEPRRLGVAAFYDAINEGLLVQVMAADGTRFGTPMPFPNQSEVDLRIQQTATQLMFFARLTPGDQSAGGWQQVHVLDFPENDEWFRVYTGVRALDKAGAAFFANFALDGDAIGGKVEYPMIANVRASVEAIRSAQVKIRLAAPDLDGALLDLDASIAANAAAILQMNDIQKFYQLQDVHYGKKAKETLNSTAGSLDSIRAAVALRVASKASAQLAKLDTTAGAQLSAMGNLLGWNVPNLKSAPQIFSLRIP